MPAKTEGCSPVQFHAITAGRRIMHPAVALMTDAARKQFVGSRN